MWKSICALTKEKCTYKIFTVRVKKDIIEFEWDRWNLSKNYFKHGVTAKETEEVFVNEESLRIPDAKHSQDEERFNIVGKTLEGKNLFIAFVFRGKKVRVISARRMHRKEVGKYDKINSKKENI